jgi:hypothetical protein
LHALGDAEYLVEAATIYDQVIAVRTTLYGADSQDLASALNNKANILVTIGGEANLEEALWLYDRVIAIRLSEHLGKDHADVVSALNNKAVVLKKLGGSANVDEANRLYDRVLAIHAPILRADSNISTASGARLEAAVAAHRVESVDPNSRPRSIRTKRAKSATLMPPRRSVSKAAAVKGQHVDPCGLGMSVMLSTTLSAPLSRGATLS